MALSPAQFGIGAAVVASATAAWWWYGWPRAPMREAIKLFARGERGKAHDLFVSLLVPLRRRMRLRELVTARLYLAAILWERGSPKGMAEQARQALDEALVGGRHWQQLVGQTAFGLALVELGRWEEARKPLEAAEAACMTHNLKRLRMFLRTGLGWVHLGTGGRQVASDYARAAAADVTESPEWAFEHPSLLLLLGQLCLEMGLWDEACARFDEVQAHATAEAQGPLRVEALMLHAQVDVERGESERAYTLLQRALTEAPRDLPELAGRIHLLLARLHRKDGNDQDARLSLEQARALASRTADPSLVRDVALQVAEQHRVSARYPQAKDLLTKAQIEVLREEPGPGLAAVLVAWGEYFLDVGNDREAYAHFRLAERIEKASSGVSWDVELPYRLAELHRRMGLAELQQQYERDGDQLRRKLAIPRRPDIGPKG